MAVNSLLVKITLLKNLPIVDSEVLQSGFGVKFLFWPGEFLSEF